MSWDNLSLIILAAFGCLTLLLTQVGEVLSKLPQIIRAWRQVRNELRNGADHACQEASPEHGDRSVGPTPEAARSPGTPCRRETHGEPSARSIDE
ncbi:hypothetical protein WEB32_09980 [Streptomyces netropsis]|uniref:hypothetical protein n=1 Tax=Streptomyces netropsis TaxID=55404 RepID=UPI0030CAFCF0